MRMAPAFARAARSMSRSCAYPDSARALGDHGGCDQFWPCWEYMSGGEPTEIPSAKSVGWLHRSEPRECTPTARSAMMPMLIPTRRAHACASPSCWETIHWHHCQNSTRSETSRRSISTAGALERDRASGSSIVSSLSTRAHHRA